MRINQHDLSKYEEMIMYLYLEDDTQDILAQTVFVAAKAMFDAAGIADDFCIQSVDVDCVIFGSYNRLKWSTISGFVILVGMGGTREEIANIWVKKFGLHKQ